MGCVCAKNSYPNPAPQTEDPLVPKPKPVEKPETAYDIPSPSSSSDDFFDLPSDKQEGVTERSHLSEWQSLLSEHCNFSHFSHFVALSSSCTDNDMLVTAWDRNMKVELASKLLLLPAREWVRETLYLIHKSLIPGSERAGASLYKKLIQVHQHFRWLVWAVTCYFAINLKSPSAFLELSELNEVGLPKRLKDWFRGFRFKDVKFKLTYTVDDHALYNEFKALRVFAISAEQTPKDFLVNLPMIVRTRVGPFHLYARPLYPANLMEATDSIELVKRIPTDNIYKFVHQGTAKVLPSHYLVFNASQIFKTQKRTKLLCVFRNDNSPITIMNFEGTLKGREILMHLYPDTINGKVHITKKVIGKFGWELTVFYDDNAVAAENLFANAFDCKCRGSILVIAQSKETRYARFPIFHNNHKDSSLKKAVQEAVRELESSEDVLNANSLKELMHRKGLNLYHMWAVCASISKARPLVQVDILARTVRKLVFYSMKEQSLTSFSDYKRLIILVCDTLLSARERNIEISVLLFLSRLKSLKASDAPNLFSDELLLEVYKSASQNPNLFLSALELHLGIAFKEDTMREVHSDKFIFFQKDFPLKISDLERIDIKVHSLLSLREEVYFTLLKLSESSEAEHQELILPSDLYSSVSGPLLKPSYEFPSLEILEEWASGIDNLTKDLITVDGEESVLLEILSHLIYRQVSEKEDIQKAEESLQRMGSVLKRAVALPSELVISYYMWSGVVTENPAAAEQHFVTALVLLSKLRGDPRGRGNHGSPWQSAAAWQISLLAQEERRISDSAAAEEHLESFCPEKKLKLSTSRLVRYLAVHSMAMHQSQKHWNNLYAKILHRNTLVYSVSSQYSFMNASGTSTPSSYKSTRRGLNTNSLSQVLSAENGSVSIADRNGALYVWGTGPLGLQDSKTSLPRLVCSLKDFVIVEIAAGSEHCIAVTQNGSCFAWGNNRYGQLGLGDNSPKEVATPSLIQGIKLVNRAACGYQHTVLVDEDSQVFTMGMGEGGVLGHGNAQSSSSPLLVQALRNYNVIDVKAGGYHNLLLTDRKVFVWGRGDGGQLGFSLEELISIMKKQNIESSEPYIHTPMALKSPISGMRILQIACGEAHSMLLNSKHQVYVWGWGSNGQLGTGVKHDDFEDIGNLPCLQYSPVQVPFREEIVEIAAGGLFSMFITQKQEVLVCGMNDFGQLGLKNGGDVASPTKLDYFEGYPISKIYCGENHTIAVSSDNMTWAWGKSNEGQLGIGDLAQTLQPIQTLSNASVHKVACGGTFTMAIVGVPPVLLAPSITERLNWRIC